VTRPAREGGFVLIGVVMFVLALTILGISLYGLSSYEATFLGQMHDANAALYRAQGGMEMVKGLLVQNGRLSAAGAAVGFEGVTYAVAKQHLAFPAGSWDSTGVLSDSTVYVTVVAGQGAESRTLTARFLPGHHESYVRRLFTVSQRIETDLHPASDPILHANRLRLAGAVWQDAPDTSWATPGDPAGIVWSGPRPIRTDVVPLPDIAGFIAAHAPAAHPVQFDRWGFGGGGGGGGGNAPGASAGRVGRLDGGGGDGGSQPADPIIGGNQYVSDVLWLADGDPGTTTFYLGWKGDPLPVAGAFSFQSRTWTNANPDTQLTINVKGTAVWMLPHGVQFPGAVHLRAVEDNSVLIVVCGQNGGPPYPDVAFSMVAGANATNGGRTLPVIVITDGNVSLKTGQWATPGSLLAEFAVWSQSLDLAGPQWNAATFATLQYPSSMNAVIDGLDPGAIPRAIGQPTSAFTFVRGSWQDLTP
jgi:hypothetical protein